MILSEQEREDALWLRVRRVPLAMIAVSMGISVNTLRAALDSRAKSKSRDLRAYLKGYRSRPDYNHRRKLREANVVN